MLKISFTSCLGLPLAISVQFTLKMCAAAQNREKFAKNPYYFFWGGQDRSSSSMLINLKSPSPVLVIICSKSVNICNRFHTIRANSSKITTFCGGTPL